MDEDGSPTDSSNNEPDVVQDVIFITSKASIFGAIQRKNSLVGQTALQTFRPSNARHRIKSIGRKFP